MADLTIRSTDTLNGNILLLELSDGSMLQYRLDQILSLTPIAVTPLPPNESQSDAN